MGEGVLSGFGTVLNGLVAAPPHEVDLDNDAERRLIIWRDYLGRLGSEYGMAIPELGDFADEASRRLLAGFVSSASRAKVPQERVDKKPRYQGIGAGIVNLFRDKFVIGWELPIAQFGASNGSVSTETHNFGVLTISNKLHVFGWDERALTVMPEVVEAAVEDKLAAYHATWVEPDPSMY